MIASSNSVGRESNVIVEAALEVARLFLWRVRFCWREVFFECRSSVAVVSTRGADSSSVSCGVDVVDAVGAAGTFLA